MKDIPARIWILWLAAKNRIRSAVSVFFEQFPYPLLNWLFSKTERMHCHYSLRKPRWLSFLWWERERGNVRDRSSRHLICLCSKWSWANRNLLRIGAIAPDADLSFVCSLRMSLKTLREFTYLWSFFNSKRFFFIQLSAQHVIGWIGKKRSPRQNGHCVLVSVFSLTTNIIFRISFVEDISFNVIFQELKLTLATA